MKLTAIVSRRYTSIQPFMSSSGHLHSIAMQASYSMCNSNSGTPRQSDACH